MKKKIGVAAVLILIFAAGAAHADSSCQRFSANPIGKLNVIGVAMSQGVPEANSTIDEFYRKNLRIRIDYDYLIDPTYRQLQAQKAVDISFFGKSATGRKFSSEIDTALELNANLYTLLIIDRQKRVRAFSQTLTVDLDNLGKVVEELLLNLDGEERITVDSGAPDQALGWQTDLGKANALKKKTRFTYDFGASGKLWYKYLGEVVPDVELKTKDGGNVRLHDVLNNKVSAILIFTATAEKNTWMTIGGISSIFVVADELYRSFTLGEAKPGKTMVPEARP
ncbi:MAG: hypothetical protein PHW80_02765 [Smithellaceae bacterium]|nr:hypothetical protein [Smithellaceae bacterium]MDD3259579.1 hypothetical protein [Smithellaceae bacterium]MDD3848206.1 hypothetical protein [Smithellaceae bacterium]